MEFIKGGRSSGRSSGRTSNARRPYVTHSNTTNNSRPKSTLKYQFFHFTI